MRHRGWRDNRARIELWPAPIPRVGPDCVVTGSQWPVWGALKLVLTTVTCDAGSVTMVGMGARILIVDDHGAFRAAATVMLQGEGFDVVGEASDGPAAIDAVARLAPDVVLLDVQLPGMDGIEVAERLARGVPPPVVVLVSSHDAAVYGQRLATAPVSGFIPKSELSGDALARLVG